MKRKKRLPDQAAFFLLLSLWLPRYKLYYLSVFIHCYISEIYSLLGNRDGKLMVSDPVYLINEC